MALTLSNLSVLAYANNFTLWHYKTADASVTGANYFDVAADMMNIGDLIIATVDTGDTPETDFYIVSDIEAGAVSVTAYSATLA